MASDDVRETARLIDGASGERSGTGQGGAPFVRVGPGEGAALRGPRMRTTVMVNLASVLERADEQLLPAVFKWVGCSFHASPRRLSLITMCRALMQALASPVGGFLGHWADRTRVIAAGCFIWGTCTLLFSLASSVPVGMFVWAWNGIGLSMVIPSTQSLVADYYSDSTRGRAFGLLYLTGSIGGMLGAVFATNTSSLGTVLGVEGWRMAFRGVSLFAILTGIGTLAFAVDPSVLQRAAQKPSGAVPAPGSEAEGGSAHAASAALLSSARHRKTDSISDGPEVSERGADAGGDGSAVGPIAAHVPKGGHSCAEVVAELRTVMLVPTFVIIILQGIVGSTPWNALVFMTLYFQLIGMSDMAASVCVIAFLAGASAGGLLGGVLGDLAATRYPRHGRVVVAQISVFLGIPFSFLILKGLPPIPEPPASPDATVAVYIVSLVVFGLVHTWTAPGCNNPVFAEIVPARLRNLIYAFDRSFEGALAALGAPVVGALAELYGFRGDASTGDCKPHDDPGAPDVGAAVPAPRNLHSALVSAAGDAVRAALTDAPQDTTPAPTDDGGGASTREEDLEKAAALGSAMLICMVVPWTMCFLIYTGLHFTYPKDRQRAREADERDHLAALEAAARHRRAPAQ
ncbi:unnamed protein product [Pedinophyceae sp. YPF-701]|nr:unnamed protein product [Pedinophyceae sp. YPF-701]